MAVKERSVADVDRDIAGFRRDRGRHLEQIKDHLRAVEALRLAYSRAGNRIDQLLDERQALPDGPH